MAKSQTIGIVGGGQLGRMLTLAAKPLGFDVVVLDPGANCPAAQVGAQQIVGDLYNAKALAKLASQADFITMEIEHLNAGALEKLATKAKKPVNPAPKTVRLIQDKYLQKQYLKKAGIPVGDFVPIANIDEARTYIRFGGKMLLKTRHGAFDGRGNALVKNEDDLEKAYEQFKGTQLYAESVVPFTKELAAMVARDTKGNIALYPVVETTQTRNICDEVVAPAQVDKTITRRALNVVKKVAQHLHGAGVFCVEMFLLPNGEILVNEIAPRVHNSGHYTIEACFTSQFEQHIRAITGLPLGKTDMVRPAATMVNILGEQNTDKPFTGIDQALAEPGVKVHLYGKSPIKIDRKMGHITAIGDSVEVTRRRARQARRSITT